MAPIALEVGITVDTPRRKKVVVVGFGMVGVAFVEKLLKYDDEATEGRGYQVTVIGEEPYLGYNRVGLTQYFKHLSVDALFLNPSEWYGQHGSRLTYHLGDKVKLVEPDSHRIFTDKGRTFDYDICVLATGSDPRLPPYLSQERVKQVQGVFTYRTVDDLNAMMAYSKAHNVKKVHVVGGGLLGLEAAGAAKELQGVDEVVVVERNQWVLSRQLDAEGGKIVTERIRAMGVQVLTSTQIQDILTTSSTTTPDTTQTERVQSIVLSDGEQSPCEMIVFSIGITPRDELARASGIEVHRDQGGVVVGDDMKTSVRDVFAIGECASWEGNTYGLIGPGIEMAEILAFNLTLGPSHKLQAMTAPDMSTRLKLLGVDVASFGDYFADRKPSSNPPPRPSTRSASANGPSTRKARAMASGVHAIRYDDPFSSVYKKYLFSGDGKYLLGGMMVGDIAGYEKLAGMVKKKKPLEIPPGQLILGVPKKEGEEDGDNLDEDTQICSCHNVTKKQISLGIKNGCSSFNELKAKTRISTGCGGCAPLATSVFNAEMKKAGHTVSNNLCIHFKKTRQDVFTIAKVKRLTTFVQVMREAGENPDALGCEVCKPVIGSILASLHNGFVLGDEHRQNQDTNDRYLANMQRNGTYSVVPRIPAGEITPAMLKVIGNVGEKYGLYTKVTGGQRIDMFGAAKADLPQIWEELCEAGFESGHAYGKALRTVKSCVGTTWCRYGIGDSVGFAVELESRYKGIRAPHKIKGGVSGCVRECAEAQSKDFGLIATLKGWNVFVGGNGGAKPRHAELLATDVPKKKAIRIIDRFLMLYIQSADKLQRTARWVESLSQNGVNGLEYLRQVIIEDSLGICSDLDRAMDELVGSYFDEWAAVVKDPKKRALFQQFVNSDTTQPETQLVLERGQHVPVEATEDRKPSYLSTAVLRAQGTWEWRKITTTDVLGTATSPRAGSTSVVVRYSDVQIAIFRLVNGRLYATQHACPHRRAFVLAEGIVGDTKDGAPYVSCPLHKRNFMLTTGQCINDDAYRIMAFEVKEEDGYICLNLPEPSVLDQHLGTSTWLLDTIPASKSTSGVVISLDTEQDVPEQGVSLVGFATNGSTSDGPVDVAVGMTTTSAETVPRNQLDSCASGACGSSRCCGGNDERTAVVDW